MTYSRSECTPQVNLDNGLEFQALTWSKYSNAEMYQTAPLQLQAFGVTQQGHSVTCNITGFRPYFYLKIPSAFENSWTSNDTLLLTSEFNKNPKLRKKEIKCEKVKRIPIYGFCNNEQSSFIKVSSNSASASYTVQEMMSEGISIPTLDSSKSIRFKLFENKVDPFLRFLHCRDIQPAGWIRIEPENIEILEDTFHTQIQVQVHHSDVQFMECNKMSPFVTLSFDIECNSKDGTFPQHTREEDAVVQIGCSLYRYGDPNPYSTVLINLGECDPIDGVQIIECSDERQLLIKFQEYVIDADPDILLGYNIRGFDMGYLWGRAEMCNVVSEFSELSRIEDVNSELKVSTFDSNAYGRHEYKDIDMKGRLVIDLLGIMQREHKLPKYSLDFVSEHFIGDKKKDVSPADIFALYNRDTKGRAIVGDYCVQDTRLPERLMQKLSIYPNLFQMANVTLTPLEYILTRGQQIKVYSQLVYEANKNGYVVNTIDTGGPSEPYVGATVLTALKGYYQDPITGLDFASLYPTVMMSNNLCFTTYVIDEKYANLEGVVYKTIEMDTKDGFKVYKFAQHSPDHPGQGLLPRILDNLLTSRRAAKKAMNKATDPFEKAVLNGKQLALKVSCNSVYGFCGAGNGMLPCIPIASCTTTLGRNMIAKTKSLVEEMYDCQVVYGDTDSVMVKFHTGLKGRPAIEKSFEVGLKAGEIITEKLNEDVYYKGYIDLEFEKVYCPYALFTKKRYFGKMYEHLDKPPSRDVKGLQVVRRDNCPIVKDISNDIINTMLNVDSVEEANRKTKEIVNKTVTSILDGYCDISKLILSKSLQENVGKNMQSARNMVDTLQSAYSEMKNENTSLTQSDIRKLKALLSKQMKTENVPQKSRSAMSNVLLQYVAGSIHHTLPREEMINAIMPHTMVKYKNPNMPQVRVAQNMWIRDPGNAPRSGDRVPYVFIKTDKKDVKQYMKAEDPEWVINNCLPLDTEYYILHQLKSPVCDLLSVISKDTEKLFNNALQKNDMKKKSQITLDGWFIRK